MTASGVDVRRAAVIADVAKVAFRQLDPVSTASAIASVLVPALADMCLIDAVTPDGEVRRLAGALDDDAALLERMLARPPSAPGSAASAANAAGPQQPQLVPTIDDAVRRALAHDDDDFRFLRRLAMTSAVSVPLVARDRIVGVLTLAVRAARAPLDETDAAYAGALAEPVALALDNAALSAELASTERQLQSILATVDAAIMVRHVDGQLVYANEAAADLLKLPDVAALKQARSDELMSLFEVYTEQGEPVDLADLPGTRLLRGERQPAPMVVRNVVKATGEERWLLNRASAVLDAEGETLMAVNLIEDVTDVKRAELAQRLLAETARQIGQAAGLAGKLQAIASAAIPAFADWAGVDLLEGGELRPVAIAHRDPRKVQLGWRLRTRWPPRSDAPHGVAEVVRTGRPQVAAAIDDAALQSVAQDPAHLQALRDVGLRASLIVPLLAGDRVLGALTFVSSTARTFDTRDLELAQDLGRQAGAAIRTAQLNEELATLAHTLQIGLLPDRLPEPPGWALTAAYRPVGELNEVGGDFYDAVRCGAGWAVFVGDVVGKGAEAATVTALVRHTVAAALAVDPDPTTALRVLNDRLNERSGSLPTLCSIAVLVVGDGDDVGLWSAGHPLPLLVRGDTVSEIGVTSPMLGVEHHVEVRQATFTVAPGDRLLLYTDGVLDALGATGRFGDERLRDALRAGAPAGLSDPSHVLAQVRAFLIGEQTDDIALVGLCRTATARARVARAGAGAVPSRR